MTKTMVDTDDIDERVLMIVRTASENGEPVTVRRGETYPKKLKTWFREDTVLRRLSPGDICTSVKRLEQQGKLQYKVGSDEGRVLGSGEPIKVTYELRTLLPV